MTSQILALRDHLIAERITCVVMAATSDYWKPFYYLLEARGLECWLVNAREVKNVPGRPKTDKLDAVWLAKLKEREGFDETLRRVQLAACPVCSLRGWLPFPGK